MLVVDASAVVELLLTTARGRRVAARLRSGDTLHAPELIGVEVGSVLRRLAVSGALTASDAEQAIHDLASLGVETYEHAPLLSAAFELRHQVTAYDAMYLVLARALRARMLTCDRRLARVAVPGVEFEVIS